MSLPKQFKSRIIALTLAIALLVSFSGARAAVTTDTSDSQAFFEALEKTNALVLEQAETIAATELVAMPTFENPDGKPVQSQFDISINGLRIDSPYFSSDEIPELFYKLGLRTTAQIDLTGKQLLAGYTLLNDAAPLISAIFKLDEKDIMLAIPEAAQTAFAAELATFVEDFNSSFLVDVFGGEIPEDLELAEIAKVVFDAFDQITLLEESSDEITAQSEEMIAAYMALFTPLITEIAGYEEEFMQSWEISQAGQTAVMVDGGEVACEAYTAKIPTEAVKAFMKDLITRMYGGEEVRQLSSQFGAIIIAAMQSSGEEISEDDFADFNEEINDTFDEMVETFNEAIDQIVLYDDMLYTIAVSPDGIVLSHNINVAIVDPSVIVYDPETGNIDEEATSIEEEDILYLDIVYEMTGSEILHDNINMLVTLTVDGESGTMSLVSSGNSLPKDGKVESKAEFSIVIPDVTLSSTVSHSYDIQSGEFQCDVGVIAPEDIKFGFGVNGTLTTEADLFDLAIDSLRVTAFQPDEMDLNIDLKAALSVKLIDEIDFPQEKTVYILTDPNGMTEFQAITTSIMNILMPVIAPLMESSVSVDIEDM